MLLRLKNRYLYLIFFILSLLSLSKINATLSESYEGMGNKININPTNNNNKYKDFYILGAGDSIFIRFSGIEIFSSIYNINPSGLLFLPELNYVLAEGKTIKELKLFLTEKYKNFIIDPNLDILITQYRPVKIVIKGEVKKPGLYNLNYKSNKSESVTNKVPSMPGELGIIEGSSLFTPNNIPDFPRIFDALQKTQGITNYADLSNIKVLRKNSFSNGGGKIETNLDLLSLLIEGNQEINIRLMDGDTIIVPRKEKMLKEQILALNKSNLTPDFITVYISGNVGIPGALKIKQGSTLMQGIYTAGGEKYFTGTVKHLRFDDYGKTEKNVFNLDLNAKANSLKNPILLDGDIIHINKTLIGKSLEAIQNVSSPILTTYGIINIFD